MLFSSYNFVLLFLPIVVFIFYILKNNKHKKLQLYWLILASFFFYICSVPAHLVLLLCSTFINYFFYKLLQNKPHKLYLTVGILFSVIPLLYFKYTNFGIDILNLLFDANLTILNLFLPLGISFVTFQQIAFLVDTYKGNIEEEYGFLEYLLFISFFPHISSGPIIYHKTFFPLISKMYGIDWDKLSSGIYLFFMGLGKKVLIADNLALAVNYGYSNLETLNTSSGLLVSILYTLQIYYDFSGYSDMAIGIARMLQLDLPINFNSPYKATTITEFWNRWHMTLTHFLTHYIYIPLGGNRKGVARSYLNTLIVFFISGLWHGASYTFILWGLLHGLFMIFTKHFKSVINKIPGFINHIVTFLFVNFTWIIFRSESFGTLRDFIYVFLRNDWGGIDTSILDTMLPSFLTQLLPQTAGNSVIALILLIILMLITLCAKNTQERILLKPLGMTSMVWVLLIGILSIFSMSGINTFIYAYF